VRLWSELELLLFPPNFYLKPEPHENYAVPHNRYQCCGSESEIIRMFWLDPNPKKSSDSDTDSDSDTVVG
jgi:hypothetical protein